MGHPVADASRSAEAVWEACSEAQQCGLSDLEPDEARAVVAATEGDLGYRLALESARECTTPTSWIERDSTGTLWLGWCGDSEGALVDVPDAVLGSELDGEFVAPSMVKGPREDADWNRGQP